jgi:hypothetical protein
MRILQSLFLICILLITSGHYLQSRNFQRVVNNRKNIPEIEFSKIKERITVTASQLFDKVSYIKLETKDDNKLGSAKWTIGNKYIIGYARGLGFFQFTCDGKYIRKLANFGRGPQEVYYPIWTISRDESHIYIYDQLKPRSLLCIDLISGTFNKNIPIPLEGFLRNIEFFNDSILICAPISGEGKPASNCSLFWQSLSGNLIKTIPVKVKSKPVVPSENLLYRVGDQLHYRPLYGDTIFQVNGYQLDPYLIMKSNNSKSNSDNEIGSTRIEVFLETSDFLLIQHSALKSKEIIGKDMIADNSISKDYIFDKKIGKSYIISQFIDDFTGEQGIPYSLVNQNSPRKYISIEATLFKRRVKKIGSDTNIMIKDLNKIISIGDGVTEFDNPILIVESIYK